MKIKFFLAGFLVASALSLGLMANASSGARMPRKILLPPQFLRSRAP